LFVNLIYIADSVTSVYGRAVMRKPSKVNWATSCRPCLAFWRSVHCHGGELGLGIILDISMYLWQSLGDRDCPAGRIALARSHLAEGLG